MLSDDLLPDGLDILLFLQQAMVVKDGTTTSPFPTARPVFFYPSPLIMEL